jgi:hypothetical protein
VNLPVRELGGVPVPVSAAAVDTGTAKQMSAITSKSLIILFVLLAFFLVQRFLVSIIIPTLAPVSFVPNVMTLFCYPNILINCIMMNLVVYKPVVI